MKKRQLKKNCKKMIKKLKDDGTFQYFEEMSRNRNRFRTYGSTQLSPFSGVRNVSV